MNYQSNLLSPSFNPQMSRLSTKVRPDEPLIYSTSNVRPFVSPSQQQYYITSSFAPHQVNNSFQAQLAASSLPAYNQTSQLNSQIHTTGLYKDIVGLKQKKESQSRITYHPYVRTYIDYQQQIVLVPVQKVRINYYEKIYQTQYVPKAIEEVVTETIAVQKQEVKVRYIPVQQTIVHFPKEEKKYIPTEQKDRRVIYVDRAGVEKIQMEGETQVEKKIIQSNSSNLNTLIANFQQNLNANGQPLQQNSSSAMLTPKNTASAVYNQGNIENLSPSSSAFEQQGQKIVLVENNLRESHVKQVYKPENEPVDF